MYILYCCNITPKFFARPRFKLLKLSHSHVKSLLNFKGVGSIGPRSSSWTTLLSASLVSKRIGDKLYC
ncbi:hypothetical protein SCA6_000728 [Theobroma cacao]